MIKTSDLCKLKVLLKRKVLWLANFKSADVFSKSKVIRQSVPDFSRSATEDAV